jgi:hypothetical protein
MGLRIPASTNPATPMIVSKATIEQQATEAAQKRQSLDDSCPYPFASEAGMHFKAVYLLALPKATTRQPTEGATA